MSTQALRRSAPPGAEPTPWGCDWCGQRPAYQVVVAPAVYEQKRLVHAARHAICCVPCAAWLRLDLAGCTSAAVQIAHRRNIAAGKRADRRAAMKSAQRSLF